MRIMLTYAAMDPVGQARQGNAELRERLLDTLPNTPHVSDPGQIRKQANASNLFAGNVRPMLRHLNQQCISRLPVRLAVDKPTQALRILRRDRFARIQPQHPITRSGSQRHVPCRREVVIPAATDQLGRMSIGNSSGLVGGSRVDDHNLIRDAAYALQRLV